MKIGRYYGYGAPAGAAVLTEEDAAVDTWAGYPPPPLVRVEQAYPPQMIPLGTQSSGSFDWQGMTSGLVGGLLNIFGPKQPVQPQYYEPPPTSVPIWVYLAIPVALVGVVALMRRKPSGGLRGYRKRRRSRR